MTTDYLYRITRFSNVIDLFEKKELHFAPPDSWDDPYERILKHKRSGLFFAQCWSKKSVSDAMWRIYSPERTGIRIRTSREKLKEALRLNKESTKLGFLVHDVEYLALADLNKNLSAIAADLKGNYLARRAADALLLKRDAFDHEAEVRAILNAKRAGLSHLKVPIDPHDLIENIYFDPRVDPVFEKVCTHYLVSALKYKGKIGKSSLYKDRDAIIT